jgi:hypothetical protein
MTTNLIMNDNLLLNHVRSENNGLGIGATCVSFKVVIAGNFVIRAIWSFVRLNSAKQSDEGMSK